MSCICRRPTILLSVERGCCPLREIDERATARAAPVFCGGACRCSELERLTTCGTIHRGHPRLPIKSVGVASDGIARKCRKNTCKAGVADIGPPRAAEANSPSQATEVGGGTPLTDAPPGAFRPQNPLRSGQGAAAKLEGGSAKRSIVLALHRTGRACFQPRSHAIQAGARMLGKYTAYPARQYELPPMRRLRSLARRRFVSLRESGRGIRPSEFGGSA